jgi:hypothetical protein
MMKGEHAINPRFFPRSVLLALIVAASFFPWISISHATTSVFINEIHYDNAGTDTGEGVEIAGPAGTDLSSWSLLFYNGATDSVYGSNRLSGLIPDQESGNGTVSFALSPIQNGPTDAIALVQVWEFLSYEGTVTAASGVASGLTSTDIGVSESSSTPVGDSLRLAGTGNSSQDFTWTGPISNTFGAVNTGQTFVPIPEPTTFPNLPPCCFSVLDCWELQDSEGNIRSNSRGLLNIICER